MAPLQRTFNIVTAAAGLLVLSPLFAIVALAIKCTDGGPVFYSQARVGQGFRTFHLLKFRSMVVHAEKTGSLTIANDARVTRCGRFLRKYKLDELPQLWNVLMGEMQLVGARPEVGPYVEMFRHQYAPLLSEPPGITDPASLAYRHESQVLLTGDIEQQYISRILPAKLRLSLEYQKSRTLVSDIRVILTTVFQLAS